MKKNFFLAAAIALGLVLSVAAPAQALNNTEYIISKINEHFSNLYEKTSPAVVAIYVETKIPVLFPADPDTSNPAKKPGVSKNEEEKNNKTMLSVGSGFFYSRSGYIITNNHVIKNSIKTIVRLKNGLEFKARLIGADPESDIAVIKIDGENKFPVLKLGDSKKIKIGHLVFAIGAPFYLEQTYTQGIISAKNRYKPSLSLYADYIQTDTAINPGSSGGPLIDVSGKVVGINTLIQSRVGENNGISLAISIDYAKKIITKLIKNGRVIRAYIGTAVRGLTKEEKIFLNKILGEEGRGGSYIELIEPNKPASLGGLKLGDIVTRVNSREVESVRDFLLLVADAEIGQDMNLTIIRGYVKKFIKIQPIERPPNE